MAMRHFGAQRESMGLAALQGLCEPHAHPTARPPLRSHKTWLTPADASSACCRMLLPAFDASCTLGPA